MNTLLHEHLWASVGASVIFAFIGIFILVATFWVIEKISPENLWKEIVEKQNKALAIMASGFMLAMAWMLIQQKNTKAQQWLLLMSVFVVATCGLIYELVAGTLASYLLGDSVMQFSTIIGTYLFAMGIGSYLSKFVGKHLLEMFVRVELLVGLLGGCSALLLFFLFPYLEHFRVVLYAVVLLTGICVGLEIPLLMRILKDELEFNDLVSRIFTFDYIGALLASLVFPLVLIPYLGLVKTSLFFGMFNVFVAMLVTYKMRHAMIHYSRQMASGVVVMLVLLVLFVFSKKLESHAETVHIGGKVIYSGGSSYQKILLVHDQQAHKLFLNGNLQFSSHDEYRYHEALVHPLFSQLKQQDRVLVLGGGDGLALREILKYNVQQVTLVDLDPKITALFREQPDLVKLNNGALNHQKVQVINADAFVWLRENQEAYDAVVVDFPDPNNYSLGKLYSTVFYHELYRHLKPEGKAVVQSTSPFYARGSFWCIAHTMASTGAQTLPYHCYVPSFGEWGFVLMGQQVQQPKALDPTLELRFLNEKSMALMFDFPVDMAEVPTELNKLNNQYLVHLFEREWQPFLN
jgi:spermidine synthase